MTQQHARRLLARDLASALQIGILLLRRPQGGQAHAGRAAALAFAGLQVLERGPRQLVQASPALLAEAQAPGKKASALMPASVTRSSSGSIAPASAKAATQI